MAALGTAETANMAEAGDWTPAWEPEALDGVAFVGMTLAALFLHGPDDVEGRGVLEALASLDAQEASRGWPFVAAQDEPEVTRCLQALANGARQQIELESAMGKAAPEAEQICSAGEAASAPEKACTAPHAPLTPLLKTYRQLFIGPGHLIAPPWGSVYTDRDCVVFGDSTLELRGWMRAHGIVMDTGEREPEDHLGLLLQQMAFLAQSRPELLDELLSKHMLTWSHHYLEELAKAARCGGIAGPGGTTTLGGGDHEACAFYEALARLTDLTLEGLHDLRNLQVSYPRYFR